MDVAVARKRGAPLGNVNRTRGAKMIEALWRAVRADNYSRLDRMCASIAERASEGDLACASFIFDRIIGRPMPQLPDIADDRAFAITWSFGPALQQVEDSQQVETRQHQQVEAQVLDSPRDSAPAPGARQVEG